MPSSLGPAEIIVILVIALIVLGPKRLPEAGRQVGKALAEVRRWSQDIKDEMRDAITPEDTKKTDPVQDAAVREQRRLDRQTQMKQWAEKAGYVPKSESGTATDTEVSPDLGPTLFDVSAVTSDDAAVAEPVVEASPAGSTSPADDGDAAAAPSPASTPSADENA